MCFVFYVVWQIMMHKITDILTLKITIDEPLLNEQKSQAAFVKQQLKVNPTTSNSSERVIQTWHFFIFSTTKNLIMRKAHRSIKSYYLLCCCHGVFTPFVIYLSTASTCTHKIWVQAHKQTIQLRAQHGPMHLLISRDFSLSKSRLEEMKSLKEKSKIFAHIRLARVHSTCFPLQKILQILPHKAPNLNWFTYSISN